MHHRKYPKYRSAHNILKLNVNTLQCYISENVYIKGKIFQNNIIFRKCLQSSKISPTKKKKKKPVKLEYLILDFLKWKSSFRDSISI